MSQPVLQNMEVMFVAHNPYYNRDMSSHIRQQILSNSWLLDDDIDEPESNIPESHLIKHLNKEFAI